MLLLLLLLLQLPVLLQGCRLPALLLHTPARLLLLLLPVCGGKLTQKTMLLLLLRQ